MNGSLQNIDGQAISIPPKTAKNLFPGVCGQFIIDENHAAHKFEWL
jgi:hypothetical protein